MKKEIKNKNLLFFHNDKTSQNIRKKKTFNTPNTRKKKQKYQKSFVMPLSVSRKCSRRVHVVRSNVSSENKK